jgi:hypothetical protein
MDRTIHLDPDLIRPLEPSEGDARNGSWISPFDVPGRVHFRGPDDAIRAVGLGYPGGETGDDRVDLDGRDDPPIVARIGRHSGKILELSFGRPIALSDLPAVGARIADRAPTQARLAARFNFRLVGDIFRSWPDVVGPPG